MEPDPSLGDPARMRKDTQRPTTSQETKEADSRTREEATYTGRISQIQLRQCGQYVMGTLCHLQLQCTMAS